MIKKLFTLFTLILLAIPLAWGDTWSYTFSSGEVSTGGSSITYGGFTWTSSTATFIGFDNSKGVQIGSGSNPQNKTPWTLTISDFTSYRITNVTVDASVAKSGGATIDVSVGGEAFGSQVALSSTTNATYSFSGTGSETGNVVISMKSTKEKAMYIRSVVVTYESASAPSGPSYYLVGSFNLNENNEWAQDQVQCKDYKFNNGELNGVDLPDDVEFKIIKVDGETTTWYGGSVPNGQPYGLNGGHHTNIELKTEPNSGHTIQNFKMSVGGICNFTLDTENMKFSVEKETPQFYLKSSDDWTVKTPMTATEGGWTITREFADGINFGFNDEWTWYGRNNYWITDQTIGTDIDLYNDGTFYMENAGTYTIFVNSAKNKLKVTKIPEGEKYELITSTGNLEANYEYIVVGTKNSNNVTQYYVMSTTITSNSGSNRATGKLVTPDANGRITATNDMAIIALGGTTGAWTLHTSAGYVAPDGKNSMQFSDEAATATIGFGETIGDNTDEKAALINLGGDYPLLKFAQSNNWFACYAQNTTPVHLYLYKKMSASELSATPVISPASGEIVGFSQEVTITGTGDIYYTYTTDGTVPADPTDPTTNPNWTKYTAPFTVTIGSTQNDLGKLAKIKAIAIDTENNKEPSYPASATYKFVAPVKPKFTPDPGTYDEPQTVELSSDTEDAEIYYTTASGLTNAQIVTQGTKYDATTPITVSESTTYHAVSVKNGAISSIADATYNISRTLAQIEVAQTAGAFTIGDALQVVAISAVNDHQVAFARDLGTNTSIAPVTCPSLENEGGANDPIDFMRIVSVANSNDHQGREWQQNNWVMLDFGNVASDKFGDLSENCVIKGGTLKGTYSDYTFQVSEDFAYEAGTAVEDYVPNVYSPANFYRSNIQTIDVTIDGEDGPETVTKYYWFMTPKPMEVCKFTWAMYYNKEGYDEGFYMQNGDDFALKGGVGVDLSYNTKTASLVNGASYRFTGVIMKTTTGKKDEPYHPQSNDFNDDFKVAANDLDTSTGSDNIITGVGEVKSGSEVVSVTYCDLAGRMSQKPFAGVNIIVTRYSDGTVKTTKAIR